MTLKQIPNHPSEHWFWGSGGSLVSSPPYFMLNLAQTYEEGVVQFRLANMHFLLVTKPELVRELLVSKASHFPKDERDINIMSKFIGRGLVTTNGEQHKKQRKQTQPAFHAKRIASYADVMVDYTADMLDAWQDNETRDISREMFQLTMYIVTKTIFDVDKDAMTARSERIGEAMERLQHITDEAFDKLIDLPDWFPTQMNRQRKQERAVLDQTIDDILKERQTDNGTIEDHGDLLSMLLLAHEEDIFSEEELRDQLITLFAAGHETTSNALTWTWHCLSQNSHVMARLQEEVDEVLNGRLPTFDDLKQLTYTEMVLKEAMRLYPPAWMLNTRVASQDTTLGDYAVKKGTKIFISPFATHRLPQHFANPEQFDPERFSAENEPNIQKYSYFPFGGGGRVCIGSSFAMMEAKLILATMIQKVDLTVVPNQSIELSPMVTLSAKNGLKMQVTKRELVPQEPVLVM